MDLIEIMARAAAYDTCDGNDPQLTPEENEREREDYVSEMIGTYRENIRAALAAAEEAGWIMVRKP